MKVYMVMRQDREDKFCENETYVDSVYGNPEDAKKEFDRIVKELKEWYPNLCASENHGTFVVENLDDYDYKMHCVYIDEQEVK